MDNQSPFDNQFVISYELLALLEWLIEHEEPAMIALIRKALAQGLTLNKSAHVANNASHGADLQHIIVDYLAFLDLLLHEAVNEDEVEQVVQRVLIPAINHIDKRMYDESTMNVSIAKAQAIAWKGTSYETKNVLCKELLKRWKPGSNKVLH